MKLKDLTAYAAEKYGIYEEHKWAHFPGFSVLTDPRTGTWAALLMRQWDGDSGMMIERCDIKYGRQVPKRLQAPYLSPPLRMKGSKWVGVAFNETTDARVVKALFDRAMGADTALSGGYTVVLDTPPQPSQTIYHDTPLDFSDRPPLPPKEQLPERLRGLHRLYEYRRASFEAKCSSFYRQAKYMEDYEDDAPWDFTFVALYPTYQDMTTAQQRGYFAWRTRARRGDFQPIAVSAAYLYVYELLSGVGAASPTDALDKLKAFQTGYLDAGYGNEHMCRHLYRWMFEFAVIHDLPPETAQACAPPEMRQNDVSLAALREPTAHSEDEVFDALCFFAKGNLRESPAVTKDERGKHLFCAVWQYALENCRRSDKDFFTLCFGEKKILSWRPLADAVCLPQVMPHSGAYVLNSCRSFHCRGITWLCERYDKLYFDKNLFQGLLHAADNALRRYLKTGRYLREKPEEAWALAYITPVIEAEEQARLEAARPKISVDFSRLAKIRSDAVITRDSLLTEEETADDLPENNSKIEISSDDIPENYSQAEISSALSPAVPLKDAAALILGALLHGDEAAAAKIIESRHLMPSLIADEINEAFYEKIGDTVVLCEDDRLTLVEDYTEELLPIFEGNPS